MVNEVETAMGMGMRLQQRLRLGLGLGLGQWHPRLCTLNFSLFVLLVIWQQQQHEVVVAFESERK